LHTRASVHQIASIVTLLGLFCMKDKYPTNMTLLAIWCGPTRRL